MKQLRSVKLYLYIAVMLIMIIDTRTVISGAREGIYACIYTVIPSLFPLMVISMLLNNAFIGRKIVILRPLCKTLGINEGSESLLILGLIGGYPIGAQCIYQAYHNRRISMCHAKRLLTFCNNAGPAFIFGMASSLFNSSVAAWYLWGIHIVSAITVGVIFSKDSDIIDVSTSAQPIRLVDALNASIPAMVKICGWVILFRIIIAFVFRWFKSFLEPEVLLIISGLLELSNGCILLNRLGDESIRFILVSAFLGFGGCCVILQTADVVKNIGIGSYVRGKLLQCILSIIISTALIVLPFSRKGLFPIAIILGIPLLIITVILTFRKKTVAFQDNLIYNRKKGNNEV